MDVTCGIGRAVDKEPRLARFVKFACFTIGIVCFPVLPDVVFDNGGYIAFLYFFHEFSLTQYVGNYWSSLYIRGFVLRMIFAGNVIARVLLFRKQTHLYYP